MSQSGQLFHEQNALFRFEPNTVPQVEQLVDPENVGDQIFDSFIVECFGTYSVPYNVEGILFSPEQDVADVVSRVWIALVKPEIDRVFVSFLYLLFELAGDVCSEVV